MRNFLLVVGLGLGLGLAVAVGLGGCSEEQATRVDLSDRGPAMLPARSEAITYAYLPQYAHSVAHRRHRRLVEHLRAETGLPLRQVFPATFDEHLKMVIRGEIDISFTNPFVYIQMADYGVRAFARVVEDSSGADFRGQLITRVDNTEINAIEDLRGKRWLAVDPISAGGYFFALGLFADHGLQPADFGEVAFAAGSGKQEQVVLAVYSGAYDVGSIREGTLPLLADKVDLSRIRVLAETQPYPGWLYAAGRGLAPEVTAKIAAALLSLDSDNPDQAAILEAAGFKAIIPAADADYDPIRELAVKLALP
jgi:phosphonate transport system substrate-binding protein